MVVCELLIKKNNNMFIIKHLSGFTKQWMLHMSFSYIRNTNNNNHTKNDVCPYLKMGFKTANNKSLYFYLFLLHYKLLSLLKKAKETKTNI